MVAIKGKKEKKAVTAKPFKEGNRVSKKKSTALLGAKKLKQIVELTEKQCTPVVEEVKQLNKNEKVENKIKARKNKHHIKNLGGVETITINKGNKLGKKKSTKSTSNWEISSLEGISQDKGKKSKKKITNFPEKNSKESVVEEVKQMKEGSESKSKDHVNEDKLEKKTQKENAEIRNGNQDHKHEKKTQKKNTEITNGKHSHLEGKNVSAVEVTNKKKGKNKMEKKWKKSESTGDNDISLPDKDEEGKKIRMEKQAVSEIHLDDEKENKTELVQESTTRNKRKLSDDSSYTFKKKKSSDNAALTNQDLVEGHLMLGCIKKIKDLEVLISLPHFAIGSVVITRICNAYTELLQKFTEEDDNEKSNIDIKPLQSLFTVGKHVVVRIVNILKEGYKTKVSLSLKPEDVNLDLSVSLLKVGRILQCVVSGIDSKGFIIDTGISGVSRAFLPKESAEETGIVCVGSVLQCMVTKIQGDKAKGTVKLTLSANPKTINDTTWSGDLADVSMLVPGTAVDATVSKVRDDGLELGFSSCKAFVSCIHLKGLFDTPECYKKGMKVKAWVLFVSQETKIVHCTLQDSLFTQSFDNTVFRGLKIGKEVKQAVVYGSSKFGVFLKLKKNCRGYSELTGQNSMDTFAVGTKIHCTILKYSLVDNLYIVNLKEVKPKLVNLKEEKPKLYLRSPVNGVIKKIEDAIIVSLENQDVDAKIPVYHLHDEVNKWDEIKSSLEVGDHIQDAIIFSNNEDEITLTLKTSIKNWIASTDHNHQMVLADSLRYPGVVEGVRKYGIMLMVPVGVSGYHGLLHKSQIKKIWQRKESISVGATVWVNYKRADEQGKPSLVYANDDNETQNMLKRTGTLETRLKGRENLETHEEGNEDKQDIDDSEDKRKPRISQPKQCLTVGGGFVWDIPDTAAEKEDSSDSEDEEDREAQRKKAKKLTKAEQIAMAKQEEQRLFELERARLDKNRVPENAMDYEELLQMSPNSSAVWIKYISYHLESAEVEKAKSIARRALTVISMSEERERLNIWTVILRLEVLYGTSETTEAAFKEALMGNDSKKIHEAMAMVYAESEKTEEAGKVYHIMTKKFGRDINVWIKVAVFYYQNQKLDQGRHLLDRALLPLEKKEHVELISRFAQLEFKFGEPERGKSMFESLVSNHPKRIDIWSVYVDVLTKTGDIEGARDVLGRMMGLNLRMNKMRAIFKKCLDFESVHGRPETVKAVKTQVQEYLSATLGSS